MLCALWHSSLYILCLYVPLCIYLFIVYIVYILYSTPFYFDLDLFNLQLGLFNISGTISLDKHKNRHNFLLESFHIPN